MTTTLPATLAEYTDAELAEFYGASDNEEWHAILMAEMDRRDQAAKPAAPRTQDETRAEWERMAHAQWLDAERVTRGYMLSDRGMREHVDPWSLWSGPAHRVGIFASEELLNYWLEHPRIDISTYFRQAAGEHQAWTDRHDREARNGLDADEASAVRRSASERQAGAAVRGDSRGNAIPRPAARGGAQDQPGTGSAAGPGGPVRGGGRVSETQETTDARQRIRDRHARLSAAVAGEQEAGRVIVPGGSDSGTQGAVAVPVGSAIVQAKPLIDGDQTLRYIFTFLKHFAHWGSEAELICATLWVAQTHARDDKGYPIWQYCARLAILGPSGSGKSWKSRLVGKLSRSGEILVEPTKPAFIDLCADNHTIILTEADEAFRSPGRSRGIVAVANASYEPDRKSSRKQGGVAVKIPVFCHLVLDGIEDVLLSPNRPDLLALMSRCLIILSRRAPEGYRPPRFDGKARATAELVSQRAMAWMSQEVAAGMADDVPVVPEHLGNRPFALWEPLFIVAQRADSGDPDGPWSTACRDACEQLEATAGVPDETEDQTSALDRQMAAYGFGEDEI